MATIYFETHRKMPTIIVECMGLITYKMCVETFGQILAAVEEQHAFVLLDPSQAMFVHPFPALLFDIPLFEHLLTLPECLGVVMVIPGDQQQNRQILREVYTDFNHKIHFADSRPQSEALLESLQIQFESR